jgi:hypothetical protein
MYFFENKIVWHLDCYSDALPCINTVYRRICLKNFLIIDNAVLNGSIHWHRTGRISNCLNRLLHFVPAIILMIFFCKVKIFPVMEELCPKNYSILYNRMEVYTLN